MGSSDETLLAAVAERQMATIAEFEGPDLAITAWAWAKMELR